MSTAVDFVPWRRLKQPTSFVIANGFLLQTIIDHDWVSWHCGQTRGFCILTGTPFNQERDFWQTAEARARPQIDQNSTSRQSFWRRLNIIKTIWSTLDCLCSVWHSMLGVFWLHQYHNRLLDQGHRNVSRLQWVQQVQMLSTAIVDISQSLFVTEVSEPYSLGPRLVTGWLCKR